MELWGGTPILVRGLQLGDVSNREKSPLFSPAQNYNLRAEFVNGDGGNAQIRAAPRN